MSPAHPLSCKRPAHAGHLRRAWLHVPAALFAAMLFAAPSAPAAAGDGSYRFVRLSGSLYLKGIKNHDQSADRNFFNLLWDLVSGNDDFYERHPYAFPPEGILAAALGKGIVVADKRIQMDLAGSRAEIVRVVRQDPRLGRVVYFNIGSLPDFRRFETSRDGIMRTGTRIPLRIEIGLKNGNEMTIARTTADYRVKIHGKRMIIKVAFRGNGGPPHGDYQSYRLDGTARIVARHRHTAR